MSQPGRMRNRYGASGIGNNLNRTLGVEGAGGEDLVETLARRPLGDDVAMLWTVIGIEDLNQTAVVQLGCGACGRHDRPEPAESGHERPHGDRTGQCLVGCLPQRGSALIAQPFLEPVPVS